MNNYEKHAMLEFRAAGWSDEHGKFKDEMQEPVDSAEKAAAYLDARLWEFIDMAAAWPEAKPDPRIWGHVMVYAPKQPEQEPVAWRYALDASVEGPRWIYIDKDPHQWLQGPAMVNAAIEELHTSPQPSKPWVGLTDEEIQDLGYLSEKFDASNSEWFDRWGFARAIEAKLRENNT